MNIKRRVPVIYVGFHLNTKERLCLSFYLLFQAFPNNCARMQNESEHSHLYFIWMQVVHFVLKPWTYLLKWNITSELLYRKTKAVVSKYQKILICSCFISSIQLAIHLFSTSCKSGRESQLFFTQRSKILVFTLLWCKKCSRENFNMYFNRPKSQGGMFIAEGFVKRKVL